MDGSDTHNTSSMERYRQVKTEHRRRDWNAGQSRICGSKKRGGERWIARRPPFSFAFMEIVREGHSTLALRRLLSSFRIAAASSWVIPMARALSGEVRRARLAIHSWCSLEVFCIVVTPVCRKPQDRTVEATRLGILEKTLGTVCWKSKPCELKLFRTIVPSVST